MEATVDRLVNNINNMVDKQNAAIQIRSIIDTKKKRCTSIQEYIDSMILNTAFLKIQSENVIDIITTAILASEYMHKNTFTYHVNEVDAKIREIPHSQILNEFKRSYDQYSVDAKTEQLEFDYKFTSYYANILGALIDNSYQDLLATKNIAKLNRCSHQNISEIISKSLYKCSKTFSNSVISNNTVTNKCNCNYMTEQIKEGGILFDKCLLCGKTERTKPSY